MFLLLSLAISDLVTLTVVAPLDIEVFFVRGVLVRGGTSVQDLYHSIRYFSAILYLDPSSY